MVQDECKPRFKGVENFLRRIAFNLGNSPSQTEVKVISCIPIDVSDLQQKIIELEKQLEDVNFKVKSPSVVHTVICNPPCTQNFKATNICKASSSRRSSTPLHSLNTSAKNNSTISLVYPAGASQAQDCYYSTDISDMAYTKPQKTSETRRKFFNKKKEPKKKKMKTQLVYYAQTEDRSPFNQYGLRAEGTLKKRPFGNNYVFKRSYLADMVRRQYKPDPLYTDIDMSEFSTPVCRDLKRTQKVLESHHYESDMCSCCHGQFRNIDIRMSKHNNCDIYSTTTDSQNSYYDSNLYDIVPVKENAVKSKNVKTEFCKRKEPKNQMDLTCCPGYTHPGYKVPPTVVNYNTAPLRQHIKTKTLIQSYNRKEKALNKIYKKPLTSVPVNRQINTKTRSVEFSEVYARRLDKGRRDITPEPTPTRVTNQSNAACLTTIKANTECQTASGTSATPQKNNSAEVVNVAAPEDKARVTLTQIRDILQTVLTEVKTSSKIGNLPRQTKKKDAIVQNGLSQSHMYGGSSLLQSYTYSPYDMEPYGPSCSQQMQTNSLGHPHFPPGSVKCMQHYPLLVQPRRNVCASCYRNNSLMNRLPNMRRAASTATNTEKQSRSKETENLIREIYKAMALNINVCTDNKPDKEHDSVDKESHSYNTRTENREAKNLAKAISEIFKNTNPIDTSETQNTSTPFDSKLASKEPSFLKSRTEKTYASKESDNDYSNDLNSDNDETEQVSQPLESDEESDETIVNKECESAASETESECDADYEVLAVEELNKKKDKNGLLSKMIRVFMPRSRDRKTFKDEKQPTGRDSVYYRTMRSNKTDVPKSTLKPISSKSRGVVYYSKKGRNQSPESLPRKSPYMEQEYRRYFDEKLTFHDSQDPKSSTRGMASRRPLFYQNVETRSVFVEHFNKQNNTRENLPEVEMKSMKQCMSGSHQTPQCFSSGKSVSPGRVSIVLPKARSWLGKHRLRQCIPQCSKQWKKLILQG